MEIYFGDVPGVKVGQCFKNRKALREAGIHAPLIAGIWGAQEGACSIASQIPCLISKPSLDTSNSNNQQPISA